MPFRSVKVHLGLPGLFLILMRIICLFLARRAEKGGLQALDQVCAWQQSMYRIEANELHQNPIKYWSIWVLHHCLWSLCFLCIFWSQKHGLLAGLCVCLATCYMQGQGPQNGCTFGLNKEGNLTGTWGLSGTGSCLCLAPCHMQNRCTKFKIN